MPDSGAPPAFRKAALGLNGGPTDELVVTLGCQLAKPTNAELVAIHVIEVDWSHELADEMSTENEAASAVLDLAEGIAERYRVRLTGDLLQAREVAAALVDEAIEIGADAIILGLPYRKRFGGDFAIGDTIPYVFQNAPCQVIVVREPMPDSRTETMTPAETKPARRWGLR
jgi:nucleotide-binding universal stress UspA family protein